MGLFCEEGDLDPVARVSQGACAPMEGEAKAFEDLAKLSLEESTDSSSCVPVESSKENINVVFIGHVGIEELVSSSNFVYRCWQVYAGRPTVISHGHGGQADS